MAKRSSLALPLCAMLAALAALCALPPFAQGQDALAPAGQPAPAREPQPAPAQQAGTPASPETPGTPAQVVPPQLISEPAMAEYPPAEVAKRRGARVVLELDVDAQGLVAAARPLTPPQPGFDDAALLAARRLRFSPARIGAQAVAVRIQYAFNFVPPQAAGPEPGTAAPGKPVSLRGTVRERGTRRRLAGIEVAAPGPGISTFTDASGRFELRGLPAGDQEIVIAAAGYLRFAVRAKVEEGRVAEVAVLLEALYGSPYEATVSGERERRELSRTTVSIEEVNRVPGTQGNALKVIEDLPGVARTSPIGGGFLVIRGSAPGDSLVFLDGLAIPLLYHFGALSSTVTPDLLGSIEYLPGNFSVQYGDMIGGLVQVQSRSLHEELHGFVNLNLLEASFVVESAVPEVPGLRIALAGRRSYIDFILKAVVPSSADLSLTTAPTYYDAELRVDYRPPGSAHELQLLVLTSDDRLGLLLKRPSERDPNVSGDVNAETGFSQIRLKHQYRAGRLSLETVAMFEHVLLGFAVGKEYFQLHTNGLHLRSLGSFEISDSLGLTLGFSAVQQHAVVGARFRQSLIAREGDPRGSARPDQADVVVPSTSYDRFDPSLFAEARVRPLPGLTLTPGLRFDSFIYHPDQPHPTTTLSPRLTVRYELAAPIAFKGGVGLYTQGARNGDATVAFGNPAVLPERALQATLGTELRPRPDLLVTVEGFLKSLDHLIVHSGNSTPGLLLDNAGTGRIRGLEVLVRKELTDRLFGWIAYTFSHSQRTDRPGEPSRLFDFDQPHNLVVVASYRLPAGWQIGGRLRIISGDPDTPITGARYLAQSDAYLPIFGPTNSVRMPLFHQLDVRVDKVWTYDNWQLDAYLDVLNVYNHRSIEGIQYSYDYSQSAYFRGLPILPTLGLKGSF
jgi:TonB family protein